ncbi:MAG: RNA pseudouridine synthase [Acidobacteria bacterium]|nr:MAG: RNA pseudouridine synthase [Acidobacteriota bacterium]
MLPSNQATEQRSNPKLEVLYEDEALLFINKPANIVVQRGYDPNEPVLLELAVEHAGHLFLLQRLDRGTSGVIFFSKSADINARLTRHFEIKQIRKRYLALCEGPLGEPQTIDAPIARIGPISFGVREHGKRAVTGIRPLRVTSNGSLVGIELQTGRTHQIRVHLAAIGHPIIGDWLYGQRNASRPMLHAAELAMLHPLTNQPFRVFAPLPADFQEVAGERGIVSRGEDIMTLVESS